MSRINIPRFAALLIPSALLAVASLASAQAQQFGPQPTPQHEVLKKDVGTWDAKVSIFPPGGGEPVTSDGVETNESLGDFWIVSRFEGTMMGMPFNGAGTFGYDPHEKKFIGTWVDSMSPYMMIMKGDYDAETKTMTLTGEGRDYATGELVKSKQVGRYNDDGTRTFEMSMEGEGGEFTKMMEIHYTRRQP
jgi:hypothetical protein